MLIAQTSSSNPTFLVQEFIFWDAGQPDRQGFPRLTVTLTIYGMPSLGPSYTATSFQQTDVDDDNIDHKGSSTQRNVTVALTAKATS
jgi:hypothetical protein